ncbi:ankyrin repeat domain-containing protein [Flavobacterium sp. CYK-4]|uniref:ankyrin repeat domain-containing protein n=1 Tax=Flavobacterium lotistagni TaxID=2709660 RepID=UPI00140C0A22|nr:ankyrin repeat domain-containing protein [Flavobacterium lotistagni]NHM07901.1 ankyrin repeat domain-containing protein [Flavobacterium lotistagni]
MKKSIIYLGLVLASFTTPMTATTVLAQQSSSVPYGKSTPLCVAIQKGEFDLVKKMVEYGADVNEKSYGMTPLMVAARYNKTEIIKYLLAHGADARVKDEKGFTALKYAELSIATDAAAILKQA